MHVRRRALLAVAAVIGAGIALTASGEAAPTYIVLPYWKGSTNVPIGKTLKTTCTGDVNQLFICEGTTCTYLDSYNCLPFTCAKDHLGCTPTCISDNDCGQGAVCNPIRGECATSFGTCADTYVIKTVAGQLVSCAPYQCLAGNCQQQCDPQYAFQCSPGFVCKRTADTGRYNCVAKT